uniref:FACT complex subunit n=1 Tax=Arcella intermedia TaxID=1963864 RepID=A0A6B2KX31_9EUKA
MDPKLFARHWKSLLGAWEKNNAKWNIDALAVIRGTSQASSSSKTTAFQYWMLGYEFSETLIFICKAHFFVLTGPSKEKFFHSLAQNLAKENVPVPMKVLKRDKKVSDADVFKEFYTQAKQVMKGPNVGVLSDGNTQGQFWSDWEKSTTDAGCHLIDITYPISEVLALKDPNEQKCVRTAASISVAVLRSFLLQKIEFIIDEEKSVSHSKIAEETEQLFENPEKISKKLNPMVVDSCYTPIVQSGNFDLAYFAKNSDANLDFTSTFMCSLGARYKAYCSDVARTFFIEPSEDQKEMYAVLVAVQESVIKDLKPNAKLKDVWRRALDVLDAKSGNRKLRENFMSSCGNGIGLQYIDEDYVIKEDCDKVVLASMVFNVRVGLKDLKKGNTNVTYSILLSDTVLVNANGPEVLTAKCSKKFSEISYELDNDKEGKNAKTKTTTSTTTARSAPTRPSPPGPRTRSAVAKTQEVVLNSGFSLRKKEKLNVINVGERSLRRTAGREMKHSKNSTAEARRNEHQKQLEKELIKKAKSLLNKKNKTEEEENPKKEFISYESPREFPLECKKDAIFVDVNKESVLLPMYGVLVPFHITTIKNISKVEDYIRIIFKYPGGGATSGAGQEFIDPTATFIKELAYKVPNVNSLNNTIRLVNEVKKRVSSRETENHHKATLKEQPPLIPSKLGAKIPRLSHLSIRPGGRKTLGTLEAHTNGFRYSTSKGNVKIDIIYDNIKHAFFQHVENSLIVALHFHLHNEIMVTKKKTKDIQCYMEVMEVSTALSQPKSRGRYGDAEEIEEEQREREMRNKLNREFQNFIKKVEEVVPTLEFDIPYRELGFWGVHFRNNVFLTPTVHCLINVIEYPFFVMSLDDVQIAYFERVQFSLRAFDLVFIFNDWNQKEVHINSIPVESLETIKDWLDSCNIKFYQGPNNLQWRNLLELASQNPHKFWKDGGWNFLDNTDGSGDEKEGGNESEGEREPDDYKPSDTDESDYEMSEEDHKKGIDDEYQEPQGKEEEEGLDWDQLDEKAVRHDQKVTKRGGYDSADERAPKRRRK